MADGEGAPALLGAAAGLGEPVGVEPGERRAAPGVARLLVAGEVLAAQRVAGEAVETQDVDGVAGQVQGVEPAGRGDPRLRPLPQPGPQPRQGDLQGAAGVLGEVLAPGLVDEEVAVDRLPGVQGEHPEDRAVVAAAARLGHAVPLHRDRAQETDLHLRHRSPQQGHLG